MARLTRCWSSEEKSACCGFAKIVGEVAEDCEIQAEFGCMIQNFAENTIIPFDMRNTS
jgi:hypothetical protein